MRFGQQVSRTMTVWFSDLRSFTAIAERLSPADTMTLVNTYLSHVEPIINRHGGVVDKYIGTWVACAPADGGFERDTLALNKSGASTMVFSETRFNFPSPDCTGNGTQVGDTATGSFLFVGTKTIGGQTVDKIDITTTGSGTRTRQVIVIASDAKLHFGLTSSVDANGYPDSLDSVGWVRQ